MSRALAEQRQLAHRKGFAAIQSGDYQESIRLLEQCIADYGAHVGPRSDLTFAYYLAGDMGRFRLETEKLAADYAQVHPIIGTESRLLTEIALAKFFEELGRLDEAFSWIGRSLDTMAPGHPLDFQVRCQKLRMLASFGRESELSMLYRECLQVTEHRPEALLECFHALTIAEARLFGIESCWPRVTYYSSRPQLHAADLRLILADLLEIALERRDHPSIRKILDMFENRQCLEACDSFEAAMIKIAEGNTPNSEDFFMWSRNVAPMGQLRLLALCANNPEARRRLALLMESFDNASRRMMLRKWGSALKTSDATEIVVQTAHHSATFDNNSLNLKPGSQGWDLLMALAKLEGDCPPEKLLTVQGKDISLHNLESLRIGLLRLNKKLSALAGVEWTVRFGKQKVTIHNGVKFKIE